MKLRSKKLLAVGISMLLSVSAVFPAFAGEWKQTDGQSWYQEDDGSYPASTWKEIDGKWYHFNPDGYMQTGWRCFDGTWYYLQADGAMAANQTFKGGHVDESGAWVSDRVPPKNYWVSTDEDDTYWAAKKAEYGLTSDSFVNNGDGTYTLTISYNNDTVIPELFDVLFATAAYQFNGFSWNGHFENGVVTYTVTPVQFY